MIVGILKEIKAAENRVSMTPAGVEVMLENGHDVLVETEAGMAADSTMVLTGRPVLKLWRVLKRSIAEPAWSCMSRSPSHLNIR